MGDILSEYGPDSKQPQEPCADCGGECNPKPLPYSPPVGPSEHMRRGPGLGGTNYGNSGTQHKG